MSKFRKPNYKGERKKKKKWMTTDVFNKLRQEKRATRFL